MPCGIHTCRQDGIVLHVDFRHLAVVCYQRSTHILTGMELHAIRIILLVVVAVDALSATLSLRAAKYVVINHALVVVLQTSLADSQFLVTHIRRIDKAVTDIWVDAVLRHIDVERLVFRPLTVVAGIYLHPDILTGSHKSLPVVPIGLYLTAATQQFFVA